MGRKWGLFDICFAMFFLSKARRHSFSKFQEFVFSLRFWKKIPHIPSSVTISEISTAKEILEISNNPEISAKGYKIQFQFFRSGDGRKNAIPSIYFAASRMLRSSKGNYPRTVGPARCAIYRQTREETF